jgi:hypothetical protein
MEDRGEVEEHDHVRVPMAAMARWSVVVFQHDGSTLPGSVITEASGWEGEGKTRAK